MLRKTMLVRFVVTLMLVAGATVSAQADAVSDFYKGKTISVVVGFGPGGANDRYARILAQYMSKYIPGNPTLVIQNMPGAGSLKGANYIYNVAPKDGTAFGTFARNVPLIALIDKTDQNVQYDPLKFTWLGSSSSGADDAYVLIARKDAADKSVEEMRRPGGPPLILGSTGEGTSSDAMGIMLRDLLGFNIKVISGYVDSGAMNLAMERGEIEGHTAGLSSLRANKPDWLKPGSVMKVYVAMGRATRHPDFPDVPTARELAKTDADRQLIEILDLPYSLSRPFAAPPGVPADRAAALQKAFMQTHKDPDYLKDAARMKLDVSPIDGAEVLRLIGGIANTPADQLKRVEKLIAAGG